MNLKFLQILCKRTHKSCINKTRNIHNMSTKFVPKHLPCCNEETKKLQEFIDKSKHLFILTGAGISTESGIPDYRSEGVGLYAKSTKKPLQHQDFIKCPNSRKRYWTRSYLGWPRFSSFLPNMTHKVISNWQKNGKVNCLVTQNVDRLHHKAGSKNVIELHGTIYEVECLTCDYGIQREDFQKKLVSLNHSLTLTPGDIRPDGDVDLTEEQMDAFTLPSCPECGGILKPRVVFFGDNVKRHVINECSRRLLEADHMLVIGSSLTVYSAYRFVMLARDNSIPIAIVNIGETRADKDACFRLSARSGQILPLITI